MAASSVIARAPGRVNLIGDHTDYNGGLALPMAIDLALELRWEACEDSGILRLRSSREVLPATIALGVTRRALAELQPSWARYPAAVASLLGLRHGGDVTITSSLPAGAGLSSSAALCLAAALAFGAGDREAPAPARGVEDPLSTARLCQAAETLAGVDVGLMDPLVGSVATGGHAVLIDFAELKWSMVPVPPEAEVVVVHSGERRDLGESPYRQRREQCEAVAGELGPLGQVDPQALAGISSPLLRRRARHVVTECHRVRAAANALGAGDLEQMGALMNESHRSMAEDFEASTASVDELAATLRALPGVYGARLTGGGFGGCVVALCRPGAVPEGRWRRRAWVVTPACGASVRLERQEVG